MTKKPETANRRLAESGYSLAKLHPSNPGPSAGEIFLPLFLVFKSTRGPHAGGRPNL